MSQRKYPTIASGYWDFKENDGLKLLKLIAKYMKKLKEGEFDDKNI